MFLPNFVNFIGFWLLSLEIFFLKEYNKKANKSNI